MKEEFLHFIWKNKLYDAIESVDSYLDIEVIEPGLHNFDAGPDFFNAKVRVGHTIWAGNVEIHLKSSDWEKHGHHMNPAYNNVILHLVTEHDKDVFHAGGQKVLTALIRFGKRYYHKYEKLMHSERQIACSDEFKNIDSFTLKFWLTNMLVERIESKTEYLRNLLAYCNNSWEEVFYISLARSFGFKVNSEPFEWLARSLPLVVLGRNKNNIMRIEALLFGQAGFLDDIIEAPDFMLLKKEYLYLKNKYKLKPIDKSLWKFLRIRPDNFPTVRIAQFAALIHGSSHLFSKILEIEHISELYTLFKIQADKRWDSVYTFGKEAKKKPKRLSHTAIDNIIINTVLPILFLYGKEKNNESYINRTPTFFEAIKPEHNKILNKWSEIGFHAKNAFESQAIIHLFNNYCTNKRCIECHIGCKLLISKQ